MFGCPVSFLSLDMFLRLKIRNSLDSNNFNPFVPNARFPYPLKTSENRKVCSCFQGKRKSALRANGLITQATNAILGKSFSTLE